MTRNVAIPTSACLWLPITLRLSWLCPAGGMGRGGSRGQPPRTGCLGGFDFCVVSFAFVNGPKRSSHTDCYFRVQVSERSVPLPLCKTNKRCSVQSTSDEEPTPSPQKTSPCCALPQRPSGRGPGQAAHGSGVVHDHAWRLPRAKVPAAGSHATLSGSGHSAPAAYWVPRGQQVRAMAAATPGNHHRTLPPPLSALWEQT